MCATALLPLECSTGDRLRYGKEAEFAPYDAPGFAWYMLPFLLAAWLASRLTRPRVEFRNILFLLVVAAPLLIGCAFLLGHNVPANLFTAATVALVVRSRRANLKLSLFYEKKPHGLSVGANSTPHRCNP